MREWGKIGGRPIQIKNWKKEIKRKKIKRKIEKTKNIYSVTETDDRFSAISGV